MIDVVNYLPEHLAKIKLKAIHLGEKPEKIVCSAVSLIRQSDGEVVAIFGGFNIGPSVFHLWGLISDEAKKTPLAFHKSCRKMLSLYQDSHRLNRVQIDVRVSYAEGIRWAETLGFKREGTMKKFAVDAEDCFLYAEVS